MNWKPECKLKKKLLEKHIDWHSFRIFSYILGLDFSYAYFTLLDNLACLKPPNKEYIYNIYIHLSTFYGWNIFCVLFPTLKVPIWNQASFLKVLSFHNIPRTWFLRCTFYDINFIITNILPFCQFYWAIWYEFGCVHKWVVIQIH